MECGWQPLGPARPKARGHLAMMVLGDLRLVQNAVNLLFIGYLISRTCSSLSRGQGGAKQPRLLCRGRTPVPMPELLWDGGQRERPTIPTHPVLPATGAQLAGHVPGFKLATAILKRCCVAHLEVGGVNG